VGSEQAQEAGLAPMLKLEKLCAGKQVSAARVRRGRQKSQSEDEHQGIIALRRTATVQLLLSGGKATPRSATLSSD